MFDFGVFTGMSDEMMIGMIDSMHLCDIPLYILIIFPLLLGVFFFF